MKYTEKAQFETADAFGIGAPNDAYAQYFVGQSFLKPLTECSLPRKTQKTDTQNEKNAPEHHVQERFLLPINGI